MTITTQFITEASVGSWMIRYGTHSDFSHVDVVLPNGNLLGARSDTATPGVAIRHPNYATFTRCSRVIIPCTKEQEDNYYKFLYAQLGKPYDWKSIVGFAIDRDWRETDSWFCSELDIAGKEVAGILKIATPSNRMTPNDDFILSASISSSIY
jgi:hypothetical protein